MPNLNLTNLHKIKKPNNLSKKDLFSKSKLIPKYLKKIHAHEQGFYKVIDDKSVVTKINSFVKKVKGKYDDIVVLGIGGSALGTICLKKSLQHLYEHELPKQKNAKLHVLDNIDPVLIKEIQDIINLKKTLFIVVSKSGTTPEIMSQYFYFRSLTNKAKLKANKHFVFVTDSEKGLLRKVGTGEDIPMFDIPDNVGGRFSVQTPVGLLPAALIGIDIGRILKGMKNMRDKFLSEKFEENLPFQVATIQYLLGQKGKTMNVMMPYSQKLIYFADWYRQLLAESTGKAKNNDEEIINTGLTPISALGVTDQHSQSQLYNEGPNDKLIIFIKVNNLGPKIAIPNLYPNEKSVLFLKKTSFNELINVELEATAQSLTKNDRPNITVEIEKIDAETLGQLFMLFEGATAFLGEYYGINAFNQPGVELSKKITKAKLLKK